MQVHGDPDNALAYGQLSRACAILLQKAGVPDEDVRGLVPDMAAALYDTILERGAQHLKWGYQNHPNGTGDKGNRDYSDLVTRQTQTAFAEGRGTWFDILREEVFEARAEKVPDLLRHELVQVTAVSAAWIETIDRGEQA